MSNRKLDVGAGDRIDYTLRKAKALSIELDTNVEFEFNGITCVVNEWTDREHLLRDYRNAHLMGWDTIGPEVEDMYSTETFRLLTEKKAESEAKQAQQRKEYEDKEAKRQAEYEAETAGIEMACIDKAAFDDWHSKNQDGYGNAVFVYARQWATLMQARMKNGLQVNDVAKKASHDADTVGLSGAQYGMAVSTLIQTWEYGKELESWDKLPYDQQ